MSVRILVPSALVAVLACVGVASADPPCLDDVQKLCAKVPSAGGRIQDCLKSHEAELSEDCKAHVANLRKTVQELAAICVWDIERFCGDVPSGGGRIAACLKAHRSDLSPTCKERFSAGKD
jgi:hypothetical protein